MNSLGDNFLAGAVLASDQDVCVRGGNAGDGLEHWQHGWRGRNKVATPLCAEQAILGREPLRFLQSAMKLDLGAQN